MSYVFVSYVKEDRELVQNLCTDLARYGVQTWVDFKNILPGETWKEVIRKAIKGASFFLACFSTAYLSKGSSHMNEELTLAVEEIRKRPQGTVWLLPVLLDPCDPPNLHIGGGQCLAGIHRTSLYEDWDRGLEMLVRVILKKGEGASVYTRTQISRATIAMIMRRDPTIIRARAVDDEVRLSYIREDDNTEWTYKCRIDGDRVIWASDEPSARWRTHPFDEKISYRVLPDGLLAIREDYYDGSSHEVIYTPEQLQ